MSITKEELMELCKDYDYLITNGDDLWDVLRFCERLMLFEEYATAKKEPTATHYINGLRRGAEELSFIRCKACELYDSEEA